MCAQKRERAVNSAINRLLRTKLPRGSAQKQVKALTDLINDARARLIIVGQEHQLLCRRLAKLLTDPV